VLAAALVLLVSARGSAADAVRLGADFVARPTAAGTPAPVYRTADAAALESLSGVPVALVLGTDTAPDALAEILKSHANIESVIFPVGSGPVLDGPGLDRLRFDLKRLTATVRGLRPDVRIAVAAGSEAGGLDSVRSLLDDPTLAPSVDAVLVPGSAAAQVHDHPPAGPAVLWLDFAADRPAPTLVAGLAGLAASHAERVFFGPSADPAFPVELARAQGYLGPDVSGQPASRAPHEARFFDGKAVAPILFVESDGPGHTRIDLSIGGPYREARVENLATGAHRTFPLGAGATFLDLELAGAPAAVRLVPERKPGAVEAQVSVGGVQGPTAEEIVARERAWKAVQDDLVRTYTAELTTSLRFRVAEINETFDLTIAGPLFKERGQDFDWAWESFYVNGIKWKGKTLPKIPILQPEKVTTLPLEIELGEEYAYSLAGQATVDGRAAWEIDFTPKASDAKKPLYRGRAWIDAKTYALLRRRSVQVNLSGETLSNVETEYYRKVPGTDAVLPLEIKGEEVFSTAGRTTAIERSVLLKDVRVNPPDFAAKRTEVYASPTQMVRDTDHGLKYLVADPASPGGRVVEEYVSKKSLFGVAGFFYDGSLNYPIPLLGVQYFDFDLFHKGKQLATFFAGAVLTNNYTDPAFLGSRFDLGLDLAGFAIPFGDTSYRNGEEVKDERLKHVPAVVQVNVGHPLGPYLKASLGLFAKWDDYQRDPDTAPQFVTPVDTFTFGYEGKLTANIEGFNAVLAYSWFHRNDWEFWGIPGTSEFTPAQRDYEKYYASIAKDYYFTGFRKIHAGLTYLSGSDLDRFSRYEFGTFSGNPIRGYQSGALRTRQAWVMNLSYGLNIENIIRLEALYDQGLLSDAYSGFHHAYYSGAGISGQLNGPWNNSLIRFDVGVPVVSHGIHGVTASALILKLF
jgi:hypothetical protein